MSLAFLCTFRSLNLSATTTIDNVDVDAALCNELSPLDGTVYKLGEVADSKMAPADISPINYRLGTSPPATVAKEKLAGSSRQYFDPRKKKCGVLYAMNDLNGNVDPSDSSTIIIPLGVINDRRQHAFGWISLILHQVFIDKAVQEPYPSRQIVVDQLLGFGNWDRCIWTMAPWRCTQRYMIFATSSFLT